VGTTVERQKYWPHPLKEVKPLARLWMLAQSVPSRITQPFVRDEGQGLAEYALILSLIALVAIVALFFLGGHVSKMLSTVGKSV